MDRTSTYLRLVTIITIIVYSNKTFAKENKQCSYACGNYIKMLSDNLTISAIEKFNVKVTYTWVSSEAYGAVMSRQKYWHVIEKHFGPKTKSLGRKHLNPSIDEAKEWWKHEQCKIGTICPPNGNCWGSGSDTCYSDNAHEWVPNRNFEYLNMEWTTSFRETCTMDWDCKFIKRTFPIHYSSTGQRFIVVDEDKLFLEPNKVEVFQETKSTIVYIPQVPSESTSNLIMECFKYKNDLLCETTEGAYIIFSEGTKCTVLGSSKYCLEEGTFNKIREFGAQTFASISDLNQVRDALIVNQEKDNYNTFVLWKKIIKMQDIIVKLIASLSSHNPHIMDNVLSGKYFTRHIQQNIFEICNCKESSTCQDKEFHYPDVKYCSDSIHTSPISPFSTDAPLDFSIGDKFKFQGKDIHISESILDEEMKESDFVINHEDKSVWSSVIDALNPLSNIGGLVSWIALGLSLINFLRR